MSVRKELWVVIPMLSLLCFVGTAGNALVLYVFSKKKDTLVSTQCIIALATVDFLTCLVVIPFTVFMEYNDFNVEYDICCKLYQFLITSNIPFSAFIMVAIALDRYFCICHPFLRIITVSRAKVIICLLWVFAAGLGVIVALMFGVYQSSDAVFMSDAATEDDFVGMSSYDVGHSNIDTLFTTPYGMDGRNYSQGDEMYNNLSFIDTTDSSMLPLSVIMNVGECLENDLILNEAFQFYYQKIYNIIFPLCLSIVIFLYILIYRSVLVRRNLREKQKSIIKVISSASASKLGESNLTDVNITANEIGGYCPVVVNIPECAPKKVNINRGGKSSNVSTRSTKSDGYRMANLKTAAMLFVVNVVFVITFMPAFLMAIKLVPYNMTVFYFYFANNVANPVIYSFMNKNFRVELRKLFTVTSH